jgi:hypothetical protein
MERVSRGEGRERKNLRERAEPPPFSGKNDVNYNL